MRISEIITENKQIGLAKKAYSTLSSTAKYAIDSWQAMNWIDGPLEKHIKANDKVAQEIEAVFAPIRDSMPDQYITLYRGIILDDKFDNWKNKYLESWTIDPKVAAWFAGLSSIDGKSTLYNIDTDENIKKAVDQYKKTGFVTYDNRYYKRNKDNPRYYDIYDRNRQYVTDGDDLLVDLTSDRDEKRKLNSDKMKKLKIIKKQINKNDIIWITNDLGSKEYIVKKQ